MTKGSTRAISALSGAVLGLSLGVAGLSAMPAKAHAETPNGSASYVQTTTAAGTPSKKSALKKYRANLGPSKAWKKASKKAKKHARKAYRNMITDGCGRDLRHAYQGVTPTPKHVQPGLPVAVWKVPGKNIVIGPYVDGIC